jgi:hypothetical protein
MVVNGGKLMEIVRGLIALCSYLSWYQSSEQVFDNRSGLHEHAMTWSPGFHPLAIGPKVGDCQTRVMRLMVEFASRDNLTGPRRASLAIPAGARGDQSLYAHRVGRGYRR